MALTVRTAEEGLEAYDLSQIILQQVWPKFMREGEVAKRFWGHLFEHFAGFQFILAEGSTTVAAGHAIPIRWDGSLRDLPSGWDEVLRRGVEERNQGITADTLCALSISVAPAHQGRGLSRVGLGTMQTLAKEQSFHALIAPVRPTLKSRYPLTSMSSYVTWIQADGAPFDPWLRTHWRLGAEVLRVAPQSMVIRGAVSEWEAWTQMRFPESGSYVVPGALQPLEISLEQDFGHYEDPNVWMRHTLHAA